MAAPERKQQQQQPPPHGGSGLGTARSRRRLGYFGWDALMPMRNSALIMNTSTDLAA
jgi:hypothetical protein